MSNKSMMSKSARLQLVTLDVVTSIIDSIREFHGENIPQEIDGRLNVLDLARDRCFKSLAPTGQLVLTQKDWNAYGKALLATQEIIRERWMHKVPTAPYLYCTQSLVETCRADMRAAVGTKAMNRKIRWLTLLERLNEVIDLYEKDVDDEKLAADLHEGVLVADDIIKKVRNE